MKSLKLKPGNFPSIISLPGSKSYANRVLILASVKPTPFTIHELPDSSDVHFLVEGLKKSGLNIEIKGTSCTIHNSFPACEENGAEISVGEGGTTARFLAGLLLRGQKPYTLILGDRLKARPWEEFVTIVNNHGGKARLEGEKLFLQGPVKFPHDLRIDCKRTTQFASGMQLAFGELGVIVTPENMTSSQSYWQMTEVLMSIIRSMNSFSVPLDWSSASYPLAFGAIKQNIFFPHLKYDSEQADAKFFDLLNSLGALKVSKEGIEVNPIRNFTSIKMNVSDCLDLTPALSFLLGHIPGRHELSGIENLVHKESNRLKEVIELLSQFKKKAFAQNNVLIIEGSEDILNESLDLKLPDDHRMVMTGALFLLHHRGGTLTPAEAVNKSYPRFFTLLADSIQSN
jgi:3-phosphoshikimate 1-carboxyvinyltransferase